MKTSQLHAPVASFAAAIVLTTLCVTATAASYAHGANPAAVKARADAARQREYDKSVKAAETKATDADNEMQQARQKMSDAETKANHTAADLRTTFESSAEYKAALTASKAADEKRAAADSELLDSMKTNAVYAAAVHNQETANADVARLRADPATPQADLTAASVAAAKAGSAPGKILDDAAKNSPTVSKARADATEAAKHVAQLVADAKLRAKSDPKLAAENKAADEARAAYDKASFKSKQAHATLSALLHERTDSQ